jgi:hypothetical protein
MNSPVVNTNTREASWEAMVNEWLRKPGEPKRDDPHLLDGLSTG